MIKNYRKKLVMAEVIFLSLIFSSKVFSWGPLTHIIIGKNAYEAATAVDPEIDKPFFSKANMYPDMISSGVTGILYFALGTKGRSL